MALAGQWHRGCGADIIARRDRRRGRSQGRLERTERRMFKNWMAYAIGAMIAVLAAGTIGGTKPARVIYGTEAADPIQYQIQTHPVYAAGFSESDVEVVLRSVTQPAAVISRALSEQPVHPHLIEGRFVHTTVYLDPEKNYERTGRVGRRNPNEKLLRAQRLWKYLNARKAHVVYGRGHRPAVASAIEPYMIIMKPKERRAPKHNMPQVPAPPTKRPDLMASTS